MAERPEHRRLHRRRTILGATIIPKNGSEMACVVRNLHSEGAELKVSPENPVPSEFLLHIHTDGRTLKCRLRWRHNDRCGVEFEGETEKPRGHYGR